MLNTPDLIIELLNVAPALERALGAGWPAIRDILVGLAARIDSERGASSLRTSVDDFLEKLMAGPAGDTLRRHLILAAEGGLRTRPAPASTVALPSTAGADGIVLAPVFYGTNRAWLESANLVSCYTGERAELNFGVAHVSVPVNHSVGELERPRWWRFEFRPNPAKHFVLQHLRRLTEQEFIDEARQSVAGIARPQSLLFLHGYNVPFESAAKRAAQLAVDLKLDGPILLYSWPSLGEARLYPADEAAVEWSRPYFEAFLRLALTKIGANRVHAVAHSMGNRPLVAALERLNTSTLPPGSAALRQIIFAAPDVDKDLFRDLAVAFKGRADRFTLYASSNDLALKLSKALHRYPRAGDAGDSLLIVDGIDTIDASGADTSLFGLGHSYFSQKRSILSDIYHLLQNGEPPERRFELAPALAAQGRYWQYRI